MLVFGLPAVLAGFLGLLAHQAPPDEYVARLRLLFLGAAALGWLGVAVFTFRKAKGAKSVALALLALAALRVCYLPVVTLAVLLTGWLEWLARLAGASAVAAPWHYGLACFVAVFAGLAGVLALAAISHLKKVGWVAVLFCIVGLGVLAFWHPGDRTANPHPFSDHAPARATRGPEYLDVVESRERNVVTRILAAGGGLRHALSARSGRAGAVRDELLARYRGNPDLSLGARISCLEVALKATR